MAILFFGSSRVKDMGHQTLTKTQRTKLYERNIGRLSRIAGKRAKMQLILRSG